MPVRITRFQPTTQERVEELRRSKGRSLDPGLEQLLDAVASGEPQDVPVEEGTNPRGLRIAIARAAGRRGFAVETFESQDAAGTTIVTVAKRAEAPQVPQPTSAGRGKRGRPRKQELPADALDEARQELASDS
jgi:hypothetical protein